MEEREVAAAILGELIPELEYAAPVLLERLENGEPLVGRTSPTDLGFDGGRIDPQLLDLFKTLAPYVTAMLSYGMFRIVQSREKKSQDELRAEMRVLGIEVQEAIGEIKRTLNKSGDPVSQSEIEEAILAARARLQNKR